MNAAKRTPRPVTDWGAAGRNVGIFILGVMSVFSLIGQNRQGATIEKIKHQTDGSLTAAKLAIAISATSLAKATADPKDSKTAEEAWQAYQAQLEIQQKAESQQ